MKGTLSGLISQHVGIRAFCTSCNKPETRLDPVELALKFGEDADLEKLRRKLVCSCGAKGKAFWMPSWPDVKMGLGK